MTQTIGNGRDAYQAMLGLEYSTDRSRLTLIGRGERREAWLIDGVIYKTGPIGTNKYEHIAFSAWRAAGAAWAPQTSIYTGTDWFDEPYAVVAMPYLPDDGEVDEDTLAQIRAAAPQTCRENYVSHAGQTYLIDGEDIDTAPTGENIHYWYDMHRAEIVGL